VGIGVSSPDASAALDVTSTGKGFLPPRLTYAQRTGISNAAAGLLVFQRDDNPSPAAPCGYYYYTGTQWLPLGQGDNLGNGIATTNLNLQANALVGSGADLGTAVGLGVRADGGLNLGQNTPGNNFFVGYQAGEAATTGSFFLGSRNQFMGYQSGYRTTTGNFNQFSGYQSGYFNTTGTQNQFGGYKSGYFNTSGSYNQFSGYLSGFNNTTGSENLFSGYQSGSNNTSGTQNLFIGSSTGQANTEGDENQFVGYQSGYRNTTASGNQFSGYQSGYSNTTGGLNQFDGYQSGYNNTIGGYNQFSGYRSGYFNTTGLNNTALGYQSGPATGNLSNTLALGNGAGVSTSNTILLGNAAIISLRCSAPLTVTSDARFKTDVRTNVPGLAFITRLRPVTYRFDAARQVAFTRMPAELAHLAAAAPDSTRRTGFLAQEVEKVTQELGFDFDGLHRPVNARDTYGLAYSQFVVPLVRAVQEQQAQIERLQTQVAQATADLQILKAQMTRLLGEAPAAQARR